MSSMNSFDVSRSIRRHLLAGVAACAVLVCGAGAWASVTSLSGAVVAQGHFVVGSYVKKVQHPSGGVVADILVREGDAVKAGDVLMRLDATQTRANLAIVTKRLDELTARLARLEAERDDLEGISFPEAILARRSEPDVAGVIHSETRLFEFRRQARAGKKAQLSERITQFGHEIDGLKAQEVAYNDGMVVLKQEITSLTALRKKGVVSDQRLNGLKTQIATFGGERGEKIAYQAQVAGKISETHLQILQIDQDLKSEVSSELKDVQAQVGEYIERKISAEDNLKRVDIIAPQSGLVHQLAVHTVGGVISPGEVIMSIVPEQDDLALEVQIAPKDIDQIRVGHDAMLRMSAFNQRITPQLKAKVTLVAADLTTTERTGASYYVVRLTIADGEMAKLDGLRLGPGMPAEAMVQTGDRTALSYLLKPLTDQINRAFNEE
ncbi:HlyD family secretion protein [Rhizobium skierniewicense]|uniref:Membrane fusion protein (MFP) family protein n=1 Tax=Rhizobium skierniewicense TaxID=984260 RepID=A0A7W6G120_9HYPH|nr:HlyD family type I secretion periplasmic adaptor subunit [Rhizobium skierniewicense]MBB3945260.1 HlyD family secretion protein [Rhizobium skierniewicense]